jgi:hypothetical protein
MLTRRTGSLTPDRPLSFFFRRFGRRAMFKLVATSRTKHALLCLYAVLVALQRWWRLLDDGGRNISRLLYSNWPRFDRTSLLRSISCYQFAVLSRCKPWLNDLLAPEEGRSVGHRAHSNSRYDRTKHHHSLPTLPIP